MARAASRLCLKASTVEMSGTGAPCLMATPMPTRASGLALLSTSLLPSSGAIAAGRHHDHVEIFAAADAPRERARGVVLDRHLVAGLLLELRHQLQRHRLEGAGGQELEVGGRDRRDAGEDDQDGQQERACALLGGVCP